MRNTIPFLSAFFTFLFVIASQGYSQSSVWDVTGLQTPPTLSDPVVYGGPAGLGGKPWPGVDLAGDVYEGRKSSRFEVTLDGGGKDMLIMPPYDANGNPMKLRNVSLRVIGYKKLHILGLHIEITDRLFGIRPKNKNTGEWLWEAGSYKNNDCIISIHNDKEIRSGWTGYGSSGGYSNTNNEDVFYEGICIDIPANWGDDNTAVYSQGDALRFYVIGNPDSHVNRIVIQNSWIGPVGLRSQHDQDGVGGSTSHADCWQVNAKCFAKNLHFENCWMVSGYQGSWSPWLSDSPTGGSGFMGNVALKHHIPASEIAYHLKRNVIESLSDGTNKMFSYLFISRIGATYNQCVRLNMNDVVFIDDTGSRMWRSTINDASLVFVNGGSSAFTTEPVYANNVPVTGVPAMLSNRAHVPQWARDAFGTGIAGSAYTANIGINYVSPHSISASYQNTQNTADL
jgi:hypothetical protein